MKIDTLVKMILILPKVELDAFTSIEILSAFFQIQKPVRLGTKNTFIRRQIDEMIDMKMLTVIPGGSEGESVKRHDRYFLKHSSLVQYFMTSKVALNVIWANNVMKSLGPVFGLSDVDKTARAIRMNQGEKVLAEKVRVVPDGIEREYAKIDPQVLHAFVAAIEGNHSLMLRYHDRQGNVVDEVRDSVERTVLGLVAKDGTIYAITCRGYEDTPVHLPMHRIERARETGTRGYARSDFNIDDYVDSQHQLGHVLRDQVSPIEMVLKVSPEAMFHFKERPIACVYGEQVVEEPKGRDKRFTVTIKLPFTVQLPPFLWSHAGWIEVVSPPALRQYVGERVLAAASYFQKDIKPRFD